MVSCNSDNQSSCNKVLQWALFYVIESHCTFSPDLFHRQITQKSIEQMSTPEKQKNVALSAKNESLDSKIWILILNTKLEFYKRIWVDRNLEH